MFNNFSFKTESVWYLSICSLNGLLAAGLFLSGIPENILFWSIQSFIFAVFATTAHFTFLFLLGGFLGWLFLKLFPKQATIGLVLILVTNMLLLMLVYLDFRIFELYKFHLNGMVLELITGGALQDILSFNFLVWFLFASIALGLVLTEVLIGKFLYDFLKNHSSKNSIMIFLLFLFITSAVTSQTIYVVSDAKGDTAITNIKQFIPWAQTVTAKRNLRKLGIKVKETNEKNLNYTLTTLHYPKNPLTCSAEQRPNVVFIVVDSLRFDMLTENVMPETWKLSEKSHRYDDHYSLANSTRFGLFNLMYGLPGNYWHSMLSAQTGSVLFDLLIEKNYQLYIHGAAPLYSPEFDRTIFSRVKQHINNAPTNTAAFKKDQHITQAFLKQIEAHDNNEAFLGFLFYDSPHSYSYPSSWKEKFQPSWEKINYLELNNDFNPEAFFNRYKNSVAFTDSLIGKVIDGLNKKQLLDNTIVIFTSDHGQEFNESKQNFWGHNGNFSKYQTQVPLVMYWPESHPLNGARTSQERTASTDILPSLLVEAFACSNPISDYSTGLNLYAAQNDYSRPLLLESWSRRAIMGNDYIYVSHDTSGSEMYDRNYQPNPSFALPQEDMNIVFKQMSQFKK